MNWGVFSFGLSMLMFLPTSAAELIPVGLLMVFGSMIQAVRLSSRSVRAVHINDQFARIRGCGEPFLRGLERSSAGVVRDHGMDWSSAAPLPAPVQTRIPLH